MLTFKNIAYVWLSAVNSLAAGGFQWNFRWIIFKIILEIGGWGISYEIALTWISLYLTDDKSTLVQVMTWCPQAASHYLNKCRPRSMSTCGVPEPQWVNIFYYYFHIVFLIISTTIPSASMPFQPTTIFTLAYLLPLSLAHLPQQKTLFIHAILLKQMHCWRTP